jgi:hypothetical protein
MNNEEYLEILNNPDSWFEQAFAQKMVADKLLVNVIMNKEFLESITDDHNISKFTILWANAMFHYAIGIENGLKGVIIKKHPELINFEISEDGVTLKDIGGKASTNHDLYSLANRAGILDSSLHLFKSDFDRKLIKNVLQSLTDMIRWAARYPVPKRLSSVFHVDNNVPLICVYGFHFLDVIDPVYDYFKSLQNSNIDFDEDYLERFLNLELQDKEQTI